MTIQPATADHVSVRPARPDDVPLLVRMIHDLAAYEREPDAVEVDEDMLTGVLFAESPVAFAHVAVPGDGTDVEVLGMAIHFLNFSTWTGRVGIYLEDVFVRPDQRGRGVGRALLAELARIALERGYARVDWSVLDWNEPALKVYRALGARAADDWTIHRVTGEALVQLAAKA